MEWPKIIQGGMGVSVSNWHLARTVSQLGQLGVVAGTALDQVLARRLQDGDPGGHMRRALEHFPVQKIAERIRDTFFREGGRAERESYQKIPMHERENPRELQELCVVANFVEVFLAREGHSNPVGINFLEKIQIPHLASIYGAMLAGVGFVLMGAGIPTKIPGVLDKYVNHEAASYPLQVTGAQEGDDTLVRFDPKDIMGTELPPLTRPKFLAIIASNTLATTLLKRSNGKVDGFVIEGPIAGGHNAPPRGQLQLSQAGEPIYGERDRVDLEKMKTLGVPFWLAGGYGAGGKLQEALDAGAAGIQMGTAFAFSVDSGLRPDYRRALLQKAVAGEARVFTDPIASPTGFPFKVAQLEGTISEPETYAARPRICDLGYLREAYRKEDGSIGYRCSSEPVPIYVSKGADAADTAGRKCLCNALMANIGLAQVRAGKHVEPGMVTAGDDLTGVTRFLRNGSLDYTAADVIDQVLRGSQTVTIPSGQDVPGTLS